MYIDRPNSSPSAPGGAARYKFVLKSFEFFETKSIFLHQLLLDTSLCQKVLNFLKQKASFAPTFGSATIPENGQFRQK